MALALIANYSRGMRPTGGASPAAKQPKGPKVAKQPKDPKAAKPGTLLRDGGRGPRTPRAPSGLPHGAHPHPHPPRVTGAPDWLAPQSRRQIVQQARDTISKAYAPSYGELSSESKQAQAISDKRASDNRYYQAWLSGEGQKLQAHADAIDQSLTQLEGNLTNQQQQAYSGQTQGLIHGADTRAGNVSNNAQSTAFNQDVTQNQNVNTGLLAGVEQQTVAGQKAANSELSGSLANNAAYIQANESKRIADLNTALTSIASARSKLNLSKTGDIAKEIARLQGIEINKAQSNRDYTAAAQKLGLQAAETQSLIQNRAAGTKISAMNAQTALTRAQNSQMNADRNYKLNAAKFGASTAKDLYERNHGLGPYRVAKGSSGSGGTKPLSTSSQTTLYSHIDTLKGEIEGLIHAGKTPQEAWHILHTGGTIYVATGQTYTSGAKQGQPILTAKHYSPAGNDQLLNAAYNARSGGPGLSPGDIAALKHMGLSHPGRRYGSYNAKITPGGAASPH